MVKYFTLYILKMDIIPSSRVRPHKLALSVGYLCLNKIIFLANKKLS